MKRSSIRLKISRILIFISVLLASLTLNSCEELFNKPKCRGCPEEQPWSYLNGEYCYPTKEICEKENSGEECEMCDRKPKEDKESK